MPRARGDNFNARTDAKRLSARFNSSLEYFSEVAKIQSEIISNWNERREYRPFPAYRSHVESWFKRRPLTRTRFSGLVGPEPDFGARESDVPRKLVWELLRQGGGDPAFFSCSPHLGNNCPVARHGCIGSFGWTDEQVKVWTTLANSAGVRYEGKRGYSYPKPLELKLGKPNVVKRSLGVLPVHRRSETARLRRAAKRGKRSALVSPLPASAVFCTRYRLSCRETRRAYFRDVVEPRRHGIGFASYRDLYVGRGVTLSAKGCHGVVPNIVFRSLKRIYSNPVKQDCSKPWFVTKVTDGLKVSLQINQPPKREAYRPKYWSKQLVRSHLHSLDDWDLPDIEHSTIPRLNMSRHPELDWIHSDHGHSFSFREIDLSSW